MKDKSMTKEQLLQERASLRQKVEELEKYEAERKQAAAALRESEELFRSLVDNMLDAMVICDWDGLVLFCNKAAAKIVGFDSSQEAIGKNVADFTQQKSKMDLIRDLALVKEGKGGFLKGYKLKNLAGEDIWVEAIGNRINYNGGSADLVTFRDVTRRKQAEEAVQEAEKRYRTIFETTGTAMVIVEDDMTLSLVNTELERLIGYSREEIEGKKKWTELIAKDDRERMIQYHQSRRIDPSSAPRSYEARYVDKEGNIRDLWVTVSIIPETKQSVASFLDITERKRIERGLQESEKKYRSLVENANEAIFVAQDGLIKFPNPRTLHALGYTEEELSQIPFVNLIHPDDRDEVYDRYLRRLKGEQFPGPYTYRVITKAGEELWIQLNSVILTWEGRPATLNLVTDITQEKRLERQFQMAQKMEAIGTLAGGIAHNFNNLLMAIQGYASLTLSDLKPGDPHYVELRAIEEQVKSGASLTSQLLAFARKGKYEVEPADLNKIIQQSSSMFERTQRGIRITRNLWKELWAAEVDQGQIEQALLNLYINAWQAMPGGGDLYLATENVILDLTYKKPFQVKPGKYVKISITDTGVGMDKEIQQRIFEPFFTTKELGRGTGLGLASVYGVVKSHGGYITVYSELGHGATFNIYLPASEKGILDEKSADQGIIKGTETVLLLDDEESIIEVVEIALRRTGYKPLVARRGEEAIEIYRKNQDRIALVILDMIMPGMHGGKVYDHLKSINPRIKVILASGYSLDGEASEIMARGCNAFIQKPFGIKELSQKIREVLDNNGIKAMGMV